MIHHVFHPSNCPFFQLKTGRSCFPSVPFSLQAFFQVVQKKKKISNVILFILVKITSSISPELKTFKDKSMVKTDAFFTILSCIHWDCLGLSKARKHLLHCTGRRELAAQRLRRANPLLPQAAQQQLHMAPSHQAQSTIHSLAEVKALGGGDRQDPVRDPPLHYRAKLASSWLPGRAGFISLQLSNFLISLLKSSPLILN